MPLPTPGTPWPPAEIAPVRDKLTEWSAWYAGTPTRLEAVYGKPGAPTRPSQWAGGLVGAVARFFWGRPQSDPASPATRLHVPVAAEIASASADLLLADPPTLLAADAEQRPATQQRLADYMGEGLHDTLASAAEVCAALGGVYLRAAWDQNLHPRAFATRIDPDNAWPTFSYGRLVAVTFWRETTVEAGTVLRHVEVHETEAGIGIVRHALYQGSHGDIGAPIPLTEDPATAPLADQVDAQGIVSTRSPGLDVVYWPNQGPQRLWRHLPAGAPLGRSDLDGVEGLMDALDETWSSLMRDVRLGKGRLLASADLLQDLGDGKGSAFDLDREVWSPLAALTPRDGRSLPIEQVQFDIRDEPHHRIVADIREAITRTAGYSSQTFGEDLVTGEQTATQVTARERRSYLTRDRKIRSAGPAIAALAAKMLAIDRHVLGHHDIEPVDVNVTFGNSVQDSAEALARTATLLSQAGAASTHTLVAMVHPDWTTDQVTAETALIHAEAGMDVPDPAEVGRTDPGQAAAAPAV